MDPGLRRDDESGGGGDNPFGRAAQSGYRRSSDRRPHFMIHLSVAIGRFVEALFWGIFRTAGGIALAVVAAAIVLVAVLAAGSHWWKRRG